MALMTTVNNPFNPKDKTVSKIDGGLAIFLYLNKTSEDIEFVVSLNGKIIVDYTYILRQNDHLAIVPILKGGGDGSKNPFKIIAMIALTIIAPYLAPALMLATVGYVGTTTALAMISAGIMAAGSLLINSLMPPPTANLNTNKKLSEVSPTYAFSGGSNAKGAGTTLPIMLGKARITPPIIGSYLSLIGDKQYLNILMALNDGEVDDIKDIEINNQAITNFTNIDFDIRLGTLDQALLEGFADSKTTVGLQRNLNQNITATTYTTSGNAVDALEVVLALPRGLSYVNDKGDYLARTISVEIKYREVGTDEWLYVTSGTTPVYEYYYYRWRTRIVNGRNEIEYIDYKEYITLSTYQGAKYGEYTYDYKKQIGTRPITYANISGSYRTAKRFTFSQANMNKAKYEVSIKRISGYSTDTRTSNDLQVDYINEIVYDDFIYPKTALLAVKAMATDQLNGSFPLITCLLDNTRTREYSKPKNNPAWGCYDLLKREGIPDEDIDLVKFKDWAEYCEIEGFTCNLYLDSSQELQTALNMVSTLGRASVVQMGSVFTPIVSNVVEVPTQSFLFTSGNIVDSSFQISHIPWNERANTVEITYYDEKDGYKPKPAQVQSHDFDTTTAEYKSAISLYGCTDKKIATRYAQFLLNQNRYITETVTFTADVDAIAATVGDVIHVGVQHMTNTLCDGRIAEATSNTIVLDKEVDIEAGKNYEIQYRTLDDKLHVVDIHAASTQRTNTLEVDTLAQLPEKYDIYAFGFQETKSTNLYRVTSIIRASDQQRKITAIEYNATVYDDDVEIEIEDVLTVGETTNLAINEHIEKRIDGTIDELLTLNYTSSRLRNEIFIDDIYHGFSVNNEYIIKNDLTAGQTYKIAVNDKEVQYEFLGKLAPPENIRNLSVEQYDQILRFNWEKSYSVDANAYEIRHGVTWNSSFYIGTTSSNVFEWSPDMNGAYRFWIKTIDTSGVYSEEAELVNINVSEINENLNVILDYDGVDTDVALPYSDISGLIFVEGKGYIPVKTVTYDDLMAYTYDELNDINYNDEPFFEGEIFDTTKSGATKIRMFSKYEAAYKTVSYDVIETRTYDDYPLDTYESITNESVFFTMFFQTSDDGINFTQWEQYKGITDKNFRYIKFKYKIDGRLDGTDISVSDFKAMLDVPDIEKDIIDLTVSDTRTISFIDYNLVFYEAPRVIATTKNTLALPVIKNITNSSFEIDSYDTNGNLISGLFDIKLKGY